MLKVINDGIEVTLDGKSLTLTNPLYIASAVLLLLAVGVAVALMTLQTQWAIGIMAGFAVLVFIFNRYRQKLAHHSIIHTGKFIAKNHELIAAGHHVRLSPTADIQITGERLIISDQGRVWQLTGFDHPKEALITQAVLQGQSPQKNETAIRLG